MSKVMDAPRAGLMEKFYRALSAGVAPIEALYLVHQEMRKAGKPITHWGAWTYVGT